MKPHVVVIGDLMLDVLYLGKKKGQSSEDPAAPVMHYEDDVCAPGGAANVAVNVAEMGGAPFICGAVGGDGSAKKLLGLLKGITAAVINREDVPTTMKIRMLCEGKLLMRVDVEAVTSLPDEDGASLITTVGPFIEQAHAVILSDYAKGVVTPHVARAVIATARMRGLPVIVDTKTPGAAHFVGATVIKPNLPEIARALGIAEPRTDAEASAAALELLRRCGAYHVVLTRGEAGITIANADGVTHIPGHDVRSFDVTGAGDSVCAALAMSLSYGDSIEEAARFANAAGAAAVLMRGTNGINLSMIEMFDPQALKRHATAAQAFAYDGIKDRHLQH